jgi:hypothetical protein
MEIFWRLMFGHLLADFTFQTDSINRWKRTSMTGLLVHSLMHPALYLVLCWPYLDQTWVDFPLLDLRLDGWLCVALVFLTHWLEDWWRVHAIARYHLPDNTAFFVWDQLVHYAVIIAVAPMAITSAGVGGLVPEKWPVLGCLFVLATHACTIMVYFVEKDAHGTSFPTFDEKYLSMSARLVLALCLLVPSAPGALVATAVWLGVMALLRTSRVFDLSELTFYGGVAISILCGLAARVVYYI